MAFIIRNTFIEPLEADASASDLAQSMRRCSSAPPGGSVGWPSYGETQCREPLDGAEALLDQAFDVECVPTSLVSPRSDGSTTASSNSAMASFPTRSDGDPVHIFGVIAESFEASNLSLQSDSNDTSIDKAKDVESTNFYICVNKTDNSQLGIEVKSVGGIALLIKSVSIGGLVNKWNRDNPRLQVRAGCHIVMVNGVSGRAANMLRECQRNQVLNMCVISHASLENLAPFVCALRGRRKSARLKISPPSEAPNPTTTSAVVGVRRAERPANAGELQPHEPGAHVPLQASGPIGHDDVCSCPAGAMRSCASEIPRTNSRELSLPSLLPIEPAEGIWNVEGEWRAGAVCSCSQHRARTEFKSFRSSAPAFAPTLGARGGEFTVAGGESREEMNDVLKAVAHDLKLALNVRSLEFVASEIGSPAAINIVLAPPHVDNRLRGQRKPPTRCPSAIQAVGRVVKSSLLDAVAQTKSTYVVGYLGEPFFDLTDYSFKATLASTYSCGRDTACWNFYEKGRCDNRDKCNMYHPEAQDLMVVWVNLQ